MIAMMLAALAMAAPADPNPLAPARDGRVQCYSPDVERRVCRAIGAYRFEADGRIFNDAENMLDAEPLTILRASYEVQVKDNAECVTGGLLARYIRSIEVNGVALDAEALASRASDIEAYWLTTIGPGEYCSTYHPKPDGSLRAVVTVDGKLRESEGIIRWVRREDGWRVAP